MKHFYGQNILVEYSVRTEVVFQKGTREPCIADDSFEMCIGNQV